MKKFHKTKEFKLLRNFILTLIAVKILILSVLLPRRPGLFVGRNIALAICFLFPRYRGIADENLKKAFENISPQELRRTRNHVFKNMGMNLVELCKLNFRSRKFWLSRVEIEGKNYIDRALSEGRGIILLSAHIGNWELLGAFLSMAGYKVNVAARKIRNGFLNEILVTFRRLKKVNSIYRGGPGNLKRMIEVLKKGQILGVLIDQDTRRGGIFVDFFGRPCYTPVSASRFSEVDNTRLIPGFIYRKADLNHRVRILPFPGKSGDAGRDTQVHSKIIEDFLKEHPSQWIWFHRRWKRQPA